ncbi:MAG: DUF3341 domain-containing protein [Planctomycetaceae bacterium]|nr:DUF3341 domain-containing protein [Planctomycetaceae bacterium]
MNEALTSQNNLASPVWGILAEFSEASELLDGVTRLRERGYTSLEAYTPFPVEGLSERLQFPRSPMPWIVLAGGVIGGCSVYALEYWINLDVYPLNIGGRPLHSWPAFIPATFEGTVLFASLFAILGFILVCGLPRLHHPIFEIEAFKRASTNRFFLVIKSEDPCFEELSLRDSLRELGACGMWEVPHV